MWTRLLWQRTGGHYLFWLSAIYLIAGLTNIFTGKPIPEEILHPLWIIALALPFIIPPFGRWLNMSIDWDQKMFDWFKNKTAKENSDSAQADSNVVKFPKAEAGLYVVPPEPKKEEPAKIYYRFGLTDNNRVAFQMGYSEITMNRQGCQNLIDQLTFFMNQIEEDSNESNE